MKLKNAVRSAVVGSIIAVPGLALAAGMPVLTGCVESLNEGGLVQQTCNDGAYFVSTITDGEFSSTSVVSATGAGGLALTSDITTATFEANTAINTGSFLVGADNTGLHITDADYVATVSNSQWVDLGPEFVAGGTNPDNHTLYLRFENKRGSVDEAGNTGMTRFNNQMNSPSASGSRYAADTRFLDLSAEGTFLDISIPDSLISFRLQRATVGGEVNEYLRFGSRSGSVPKAEANGAWSRFTIDGVQGDLLTTQQSMANFGALIDAWQAQAAGEFVDQAAQDAFFASFHDFTMQRGAAAPTAVDDFAALDTFFQNTNFPYAATAFVADDFALSTVGGGDGSAVFEGVYTANDVFNFDGTSAYTYIGNNAWNYSGPF